MRYKLAKIKTSHHAMGKLSLEIIKFFFHRIIPSHEGQMQSFSASAPGILKHPLIRGADFLIFLSVSSFCDSSPLARGRLSRKSLVFSPHRFIPSCEGQTLSVYAAFSRLKHLVVQFAQMSFSTSTRHTSFPLLIICLKNILFVFLQIFFKLS